MEKQRTNVEEIVSQASNWTFAGDHLLLQWMEQIAETLESRANNTSGALEKLSANVGRTGIALNNAANSLTALQFGNQFVESRVHDDDETVPEVSVNVEKSDSASQSLLDPLQTFLQNNLRMLRNCHEKYAISLEDSDDEDDQHTNTCIYQPKNPYNVRPLPHILGSKAWHEHWHVGLCESAGNDYSGDELSEAFSESSTSVDDNESYGSSNVNGSQWASNTSIHNESFTAPIAVKNASSLHDSQQLFPDEGLVSQTNILPATKSVPPAASSSDSNSTHSRVVNMNPVDESDLFAPVQSAVSRSASASNSVAGANNSRSSSVSGSSRKNVSSTLLAPAVHPQAAAGNLFNEDESSSGSFKEPRPAGGIKRKPVNLFDDDDFNSFMSEIVDKVQSKSLASGGSRPTAGDSGNRSTGSGGLVGQPIPVAKAKASSQKPHKNLFESPKGSPVDKPLLESISDKTKTREEKGEPIKPVAKTSLSAKNLFDDDDDDDDFLSVFVGNKPFSVTNRDQPPQPKSLFDDEDEREETKTGKTISSRKPDAVNLFEDETTIWPKDPKSQTPDLRDFSDDKIGDRAEGREQLKAGFVDKPSSVAPPVKTIPSTNLFGDEDDIDENSLFKTAIKTTQKVSKEEEREKEKPGSTAKKPERHEPEEQLESKSLHNETSDSSRDFKETKSSKKSAAFVEVESVGDVPQKKVLGPGRTLTEPRADGKMSTNEGSHDLFVDFDDGLVKGGTGGQLGTDVVLKPDTNDKIKTNSDAGRIWEDANSVSKQTLETRKSSVDSTNHGDHNGRDRIVPEIPAKASRDYSYSSSNIFLDEPPDDHEFLGSLGPNPKRPSITLDLESELFEPALPQIPTKTTANAFKSAEAPSAYTGFQLFSEVPPPDDDVSEFEKESTEPNRLHSVFFDDFNETLDAVRCHDALPTHSVFDSEPPPVEHSSNPYALPRTESLAKPPRSDAVDHVAVRGGHNEEPISQPPSIGKESNANSGKDSSSMGHPVPSKLQRPNININVTALLPGAAGKVNFRKNQEKTLSKDTEVFGAGAIGAERLDSHSELEAERPHFGGNILSNVNKHRVRASGKRRPSTRRARLENYRQLQAKEREDNEAFTNDADVGAKYSEAARTASEVNPSIDDNLRKTEISKEEENPAFSVNSPEPARKPAERTSAAFSGTRDVRRTNNQTLVGGLFGESDDEDDDLFKSVATSQHKPPAPPTTRTPSKLNETPGVRADAIPIVAAAAAASKPSGEGSKKSLNLFDDSDSADDDLFVEASKAKSGHDHSARAGGVGRGASIEPVAVAPKKEPPKGIPFGEGTSDDESDDDLFKTFKKKNTDATPAPAPTASSSSAPQSAQNSSVEKVGGGGGGGDTQTSHKATTSIFDDSDTESGAYLPTTSSSQRRNLKGSLAEEKEGGRSGGSKSGRGKSLFSDIESDDDDDDDLFGSSGKKAVQVPSATPATKRTAPPKQQPAAGPPSGRQTVSAVSALMDNPLADLLDP